jgi:hydrogenase small subunit
MIPEESSSLTRLSRRDFLKISMMLTAILAIPKSYADMIAKAMSASVRLPVIWLEFQDCTGDSESFLRAGPGPDAAQKGVTDPSLVSILLDKISLEYHETLMASAGTASEKSLNDVMTKFAGQYVCVVEGAIPTANNGVYCTIRGRTALSMLQEVTAGARATIAMGTCAWDGGLSAAAPNPTGAKGVKDAIPGLANLLALPGCPANVVNMVASFVYLLTFNTLPARDSLGRPLFAYGSQIHHTCERRPFYEQEKFVRAWGDDGHKQGWCLMRMGCKGPVAHSNCNNVLWNGQTNWPVRAGHGCLGCVEPNFWDNLTPIYTKIVDD